ncbi:MAG: response regulator transcription factor [Flavobacteriaceae bacterium]|jgi:DNA-binding NarL/FixJ family response regulator|nr:response regulator transcription factor [Flavobacteriaceae bacterium]
MKPIKIAIVDDHQMFLRALDNMISTNPNFEVMMTSKNGAEFLQKIDDSETLPEVVLMDVKMPIKNGIETTSELLKKHPQIKVVALTMEDAETTIIQMLKAGAKGYLLKDMPPEILFDAIEIVSKDGVFYTDAVAQSVDKIKAYENESAQILNELKPPELEFLKWACTELTYKEIADKMFLSPRTIDGYRDSVFHKLNVKSRVGIVLFAMKNKLVY